jgi:hypothetical protein
MIFMAEISSIQPAVTPRSNQNISQQVKTDTNGLGDISRTLVDPSRVVRTNDQNVNTGDEAYRYGQDSNYESFIRTLRSMPELSEIYNDVFMTKLTSTVNLATYGKDFAEQVFQFMESIKMSPEQLLNMMKEQNVITNKFTGPFFDIIRNMISGDSSREMAMAVLDFLKRYDAYTSNSHTENVMLSNLKGIAANIPKSQSDKLVQLIQKYPADGTHEEKLNFLKNDVMPFLTKYVSQTHDYGVARDMIALFAVSLGKFETGSETAFIDSFRNLAGYLQLMGMLDGIDVSALQERLMSRDEAGSMNTEMLDAFVSILEEGLGGKAGAANKAAFQDMISALLVNESVYMPVTHMVIPANINGNMLFSEMWVDPDAENEGERSPNDPKTSKLFVKFMIKELGNFDLLIIERDGKVNMELHYPESMSEKAADIRHDVSGIVRNNDLTIDTLTVAQGKTEKSIIEIFPKIFSNKNSVNVTV